MVETKKGVQKGTHRKLNKDDRHKIERLVGQGISNANIARVLGVHRKTIGEELKRCDAEKDRSRYSAEKAQETVGGYQKYV